MYRFVWYKDNLNYLFIIDSFILHVKGLFYFAYKIRSYFIPLTAGPDY